MTDAIPDFLKDDKVDMSSFASDENLSKGRQLAEKLAQLDQEISDLEENVKKKKEERLELVRRTIPEFFGTVLQIDRIGVPNANVDVVVVPYYHANIAADWEEDRRNNAFNYLEKNGHGDLISGTMEVKFRRGDLAEIRELQELIRNSKFGNKYTATTSLGVPWNTLTAFVKEQIENNQKLDLDVLGATVARQAKIMKRKK
jgi:hypothetical protein